MSDGINTDWFVNYLQQSKEGICHRCGNRDPSAIWVDTGEVPTDPTPRLPHYPFKDIEENILDISKGRYLPVSRVTCLKCGLVCDYNNYALAQIKTEKAQNGDEG